MGPELDALGPYELERGDIGQHSLDVAAHRLDEAQKGLQRRELLFMVLVLLTG